MGCEQPAHGRRTAHSYWQGKSCCRQCSCFYWTIRKIETTIGDWPEDIPFLLIMEKELLQLRASVLQCQSTALRATCPRMAAGCAAGGAAGCPGLWCRAGSLLCPRGCVPGQGLCRLPGSALSLPGELPRALRGDVWGEGTPRRAGQGPSAATAAAWGRGITATLHHRMFSKALCKRRVKGGIFLLYPLGSKKGLEAEI